MSRTTSLTTRVVVVLLSAAIVPTAFVGYLAIRHAQGDVEREVVRGNLALIRALGRALDTELQDAWRVVELAGAAWADRPTDKRVCDAADSGPAGSGEPGGDLERPIADADASSDHAVTRRLLRRLRTEVPLFSTITITDAEGRFCHGDPDPPDIARGEHTGGGYVSDVFFEDGVPRVALVTQARNRTGALDAVFIARLDLHFVSDALRELVEESRLGQGARLWVVDGQGRPVARSDGAPITDLPSASGNLAVQRALQSTGEGAIEISDQIAVYRNMADYQTERAVRWAIIMDQPTEYAYALARKTKRDTIITGVAVLALSLLIGTALATRLTGPLHQLAERADAIAGYGVGDDMPEAPINAPGEIGQLALRIEEMARRIGEREKLQAALARGDRLASVGTMAASVAHEVNNPLTTILGYANLLQEGKDDDHPDRSGLELIAEEAARMKSIVSSLLDYSRSERGTEAAAGVADVNETARHTGDLMVPQLRRSRVLVTMDLEDDLPMVACSAHALQQVFVNLVQNAAQAMPDGGEVQIASLTVPGDVAVEVTVTDTGPGIPDHLRPRIFDAFVTSKEAGAGTGLGLAVCKHLITSVGGSIEVQNGPDGRGARFRVVVPIAGRSSVPSANRHRERQAIS